MALSFLVKPMLAASEIPEPHEIPFPMLFSFKYDGVRNLVVDHNAYSRNMELWPNLFVQKWFYQHGDLLEGFDGELIVGPPTAKDVFQKTMSGITSADGIPNFIYYVFDLWNMGDMHADHRLEVLKARFQKLPKVVRDKIVVVEQARLTQYAHLKMFYDKAILLGYEGLIGKHPDRKYKNGRSTLNQGTLLKFKEFADSEIRIDSIDQGKSNQNELTQNALGYAKRSTAKAGKVLTPTIGAFLGVDVNPKSPFYNQPVRVGPGDFDKAKLEVLFMEHVKWVGNGSKGVGPVVGRYLTYKYQVTGVKDKPRYPGARSAKGFRSKSDF